MRLREVEKGDSLFHRILFSFISKVSGMRLPDAARIVFYHKEFYGDIMGTWTHAAMRGKSGWSVGERELMAAMTAQWNSCTFCIEAHAAIASLALDKSVVESAIVNFQQEDVPVKLKTILVFLEILTRTPDDLTAKDVQNVLHNGITLSELEDAIAVTALFNITVRSANTLNFALLSKKDLEGAAKRMLTQGYAFGKSKTPARPDHTAMANSLSQRVFQGPGISSPAIRSRMGKRVNGGAAIEAPYDNLAKLIAEASYKITDAQITELVKEVGSEKAAFELLATAAVSAGLYRWEKGQKVIKEK